MTDRIGAFTVIPIEDMFRVNPDILSKAELLDLVHQMKGRYRTDYDWRKKYEPLIISLRELVDDELTRRLP